MHEAGWFEHAERDLKGILAAYPGERKIATELLDKIKKERIKVVVSEIQLSQKLPTLLAKETKTRIVVLTTLPGGLPGTETYIDMLRYNVLQLANALESP